MPTLVTNCPRCSSARMTFDVKGGIDIGESYGWKHRYEAFSVCRQCNRTVVLQVSDTELESNSIILRNGGLGGLERLSEFVWVDGYVSLKDRDPIASPEHLPEEIGAAFEEAAKCMAAGCPNAAAAMFRLCLDHATRERLPDDDRDGLNPTIRRTLGRRIQWLFQQGLLPDELEELSDCVREDGNDAAHAGTLTQEDAEDLLDFTVALLERLYTEPKRLELAKERRVTRRTTT